MSDSIDTLPAGAGWAGGPRLDEAPASLPEPGGREAPGTAPPRVLGSAGDWLHGPRLVCVAGLHGNEPAGVLALERVFAALEESPRPLRGGFLGLAGNRSALAVGRRFLAEDMNRLWLPERVGPIRAGKAGVGAEERELRELDTELQWAVRSAPAKVFLLDIHSTSGPGPAFAVLEDTLPNRVFALELGVPLVLGLEEELAGTLSHHMAAQGVVTVGFEAGQHADPDSADRAEAAIWIALRASGVLAQGGDPRVAAARRSLRRATRDLPRVVEVRYRHSITAADCFQMRDGLQSFRAVESGEVLAQDRRGSIRADEGGLLLMPLYQRQGEDGFFLVRRVHFFWLQLSALLRRLRLDRIVHWLPGIERHPDLPDSFLVDRRTARWRALELFHLLGFRRRISAGPVLVVARRRHDRP